MTVSRQNNRVVRKHCYKLEKISYFQADTMNEYSATKVFFLIIGCFIPLHNKALQIFTKIQKSLQEGGQKGPFFQFQFIWVACCFYFKVSFENLLKIDPTYSFPLHLATPYKEPCLQETIVNL